jgi:hypothetical protein
MEIVTSWEREGIQKERRATITKILKLRFGDIDASLEGIIPALLHCPPMNIWIHSYKLTVRSCYRGFKGNRKWNL